ncbi:DUF4393 domain-containing protein [Mammaliicoccus sciuri]|uniref:DUF4393 domain-containing protein n=1 Tax=Mammaliicoccus sciuri TaxID=1296 RepID=UPI0036EACD98
MDPIIGKGLDKIIDGAAEGPIKTLNLTWDLVFGGYHTWINKIQYKREINLNDFKESLNSNVQEIPTENIQEPKISLLGPALDASKFYIDEKVIRDLFSNLIASSMDNRKNNDIHHSFVEIIKQMSSDDAILFEHLSKAPILSAVKYVAMSNKGTTKVSLSDVVIKDSPLSYKNTEISIINLKRIGLIEINIGLNSLTHTDAYKSFDDPNMIDMFTKKFENNYREHYSKIFQQIKVFGVAKLALDNNVSVDEIYKNCSPSSIEYEKGFIEITSFGKAFINCCLK